MTQLSTILDQIDSGTMLLPEFQRGYVWNRDQVRGLMRSLYRGYPVGALLIWETEPTAAAVRGPGAPSGGAKQLLLDGQQRITTLYGIARGRPPAFFEGDANAFTGLRFNLETEVFEFFAPTRMKGDPLWVDVTDLFVNGLEPHIAVLSSRPDLAAGLATYLTRLTRLRGLLERDFHSEKITGVDKTIDHVVEIFNKVNSGGTKLSKGDLALAKVCAHWPNARGELRSRLGTWRRSGYDFSLDWLLRNVNAVATGRAPFEHLDHVSTEEFQAALESSTRYVGGFLDLAAGRLGLDHDRVLMARYSVPVISRLQHLNGGTLGDWATQDQILYWYVNAGLWGRFAGSTETVLARDYDIAQAAGIDGLISEMERWRGGNLRVSPHDFNAFGVGSRFYPLLYLMTRMLGARDFGTGIELKRQMLGHNSSLQVHHLFPKALLYRHGYQRGEVNSVANFSFLTQQSNLAISAQDPLLYFPRVETAQPGVLASQWIPQDPDLWKVENYGEFLEARQSLLAEAANALLDELRSSKLQARAEPLPRVVTQDPSEVDDDLDPVRALVAELEARGLATPAFDVEISDPETGDAIAIAEAYWEDGLQVGQGDPVILELDPDPSGLSLLEGLGMKVFTSVDALREYAERRADDSSGVATATEPEPEHRSDAIVSEPTEEQARVLFGRAMQDVYSRAKKEAGYNATIFLDMLHRYGAIETARKLLGSPSVSDGYRALYERGRLDLTVENVVLRPEFEALFADDERDIARRRLDQFDFDPGY